MPYKQLWLNGIKTKKEGLCKPSFPFTLCIIFSTVQHQAFHARGTTSGYFYNVDAIGMC